MELSVPCSIWEGDSFFDDCRDKFLVKRRANLGCNYGTFGSFIRGEEGEGEKKPLESKANEFLKWDKKWIEIRIILFSARFNRVE